MYSVVGFDKIIWQNLLKSSDITKHEKNMGSTVQEQGELFKSKITEISSHSVFY